MKKFSIFDQNRGLTSGKNANFMDFLNRFFYGQDRLFFFYLKRHKSLSLGKICLKRNVR